MSQAAPSHPPEAILVLDDDESSRTVIGRVVQRLGAVPKLADSMAVARQLVLEGDIACALIDKNLGHEDGLDFLRWLRANRPDCDAVMITGYGNLDSAIEALRLGAADYLQKPFELDSITHRLKLLVERRQMVRERRLMQAQLLQSDRLAALGTLAAGVVHEINNPLTYVLANLDFLAWQLAQMRLEAPSPALEGRLGELCEVVTETQSGTALMAGVVGHIKTFARHERVERSRTDLRTMLEGTLKMSTALVRLRARLVRDFSPAPTVFAFQSQLAQVFLNLIVNASHAIPEGKANENSIRVALRTGPTGEAVVEVADTGSGMSPEVLGSLFRPFFTTKAAGVGTGIGLTICRNIVESHGGRIEVESTLGNGSLFRVLLPPMPSGSAAAESRAAPTAFGRRGRLLVIDDDEALAVCIQRFLATEHEVMIEHSGAGALARIEQGERFDAILCDLMMPDVTGQQLYATLEKLHPEQASKVLFMTAGVLSSVAADFAAAIAGRLFEKPFDVKRVQARVRELVNG